MKKSLLVALLCLALALLATQFQAYCFSEQHLRTIAVAAASEYCKRHGIDPVSLSSPIKLDAQSKAGHYEWHYKLPDKGDLILGVWVYGDGYAKVYVGVDSSGNQ